MGRRFLLVITALMFLSTNSNSQILNAFSDCGKSINCFTLPESCSSFSECEGVGMYYYNSTDEMFYITMATKNSYVAFAQNLDSATDRMDDNLKGSFCSKNGNNVTLGFLTGNGSNQNPPHWHEHSLIKDATLISKEVKDGIAKCSYKRPSVITDAESQKALHNFDATNLINIIASGTSLNGVNPKYHDKSKRFTSTAIANFKDKSTSTPTETTTPTTTTTKAATTPSSSEKITGSVLSIACLLIVIVFFQKS